MFYTYLWLREDGTPYYIGKGTGDRGLTSHGHSVNRPKSKARIFVQYWESEEKAFEMEKWYISFFGRKDLGAGILRNMSDGGEGPSGYKWKPERKGHKDSDETKRKKSEARKGIKYSDETIKRMRESHLGHVPTSEARRKNGLAHKGKVTSEETKSKMREAAKGRVISQETKIKMSEAAKKRYKK